MAETRGETFRHAFEKAGYVPAAERLRNMALDVIRRDERIEDFARAVQGDFEALMVLCSPYLAEVASDETRSQGGHSRDAEGQSTLTPLGSPQTPRAGQAGITESHSQSTCPGHPLGGGHTSSTDGQSASTPAEPDTETRGPGAMPEIPQGQACVIPGASQPHPERAAGLAHATDGQPAITRHTPGHARPISDAAKAIIAGTMRRSLLDTHRMVNGKAIGDCTYAEIERIERDGTLCRLLRQTVAWHPAMDDMPTREWLDEDTLRDCLDKARQANA